MTRLLNTAIIGRSAKAVASSRIDIEAGLSGLYIRRTPPGFCACAGLLARAAKSRAPAMAGYRRQGFIAPPSRARRSGPAYGRSRRGISGAVALRLTPVPRTAKRRAVNLTANFRIGGSYVIDT